MYIYIYIYVCICGKCSCVLFSSHNMYVYIYCGRKKTNRLPVHPYRPVSWLPTHQGFVCIYIHTYINIMRGKKDATTFPDKPVS